MRIDLPEQLTLCCPHCDASIGVRSKALDGLGELVCPFCAESISLYDALPVLLRRRVYHALRDALESKVYHMYRRHHRDTTDPWTTETGTDGSEADR